MVSRLEAPAQQTALWKADLCRRRTPAFILSASTEHADDPGRTGKDFLSRRILCRCYESSFEGGGFKFCPHADCRDGKLNIIVVSGLSKLKVLLLLPTAFFGLHTRFHGVCILTPAIAQSSERGRASGPYRRRTCSPSAAYDGPAGK